jgi:hypothetical protein
MHDGTKIKACAGADSFRREEKVRAHLAAARQQVEAERRFLPPFVAKIQFFHTF